MIVPPFDIALCLFVVKYSASLAVIYRILFPPPKTLTLVLLPPYRAKITKSRETSLGFRRCGRISGCSELLEDLLGFCLDDGCCLKIARCATGKPDGGSSSQAACGFVLVASGRETRLGLGIIAQRLVELPLCCCQFTA